ncbi:MAG: tyrosine--tRNA ligase [Nitrososphaerales archaeon]
MEKEAKEVEKQFNIIVSGTEEVIPREELLQKLRASLQINKPLKIKFGVDPTSPDLHLGHAVILRKLRDFQDLGHIVILLIGDYTARVGDPSGRSSTRPMLSPEEIEKNAKTYTDQAFKILDPKKTIIDYNSRWFSKMGFDEVLKLTAKFTVARLLERDDFEARYKKRVPIFLHEFLYPIMQGYDSVALKCDVEIGGTDQKFNMLAGRMLQEEFGQEPQVVITMPILEGIDGVRRMSKSLGNYVGLTEPPEEMFGKIMSIPDELMVRYFKLATDLSLEEISQIEKGLRDGSLHPAEVKRRLAWEIVRLYHGEEEANKARSEFNRVFKEKELPSKIPYYRVPEEIIKENGRVWIVRLLTSLGLAETNSEAKRLIEQSGVKIDGRVVNDVDLEFIPHEGQVVQVGKRKFARLRVKI